jgi:hypothetical protein
MRHDTRLHLKRAMRVACRRPFLTIRAGSAGGPEPGRVGFYGELGRTCFRLGVALALCSFDLVDDSGYCIEGSIANVEKN